MKRNLPQIQGVLVGSPWLRRFGRRVKVIALASEVEHLRMLGPEPLRTAFAIQAWVVRLMSKLQHQRRLLDLAMRLVASTTALFVVTFAGHAWCCSIASPSALVIDPAEQALDVTPPAKVSTVVPHLRRGVGPKTSGCGEVSQTSCDDLGNLGLTVTAPADDRTAPEQLGYIIRVVAGAVPSGLNFPAQAVVPLSGALYFAWIDGATDNQEPVDFTIEVIAVDRAGNEGPASAPLRIADDGDAGCRLARSGDATSFLLVLAALFGLRRLQR